MTVLLGAIVVAVAEIYVLIRVASAIGAVPAILLLLAVSACGPWLAKRAGLSVWRRAHQRLSDGELPGREMLDGLMLLIAGVFITIPGFILGTVGLLLLVPPVRAAGRRLLLHRFARRIAAGPGSGIGGGRGGQRPQTIVIAGSHDPTVVADRHQLPGTLAGAGQS